MTVINTDRQGGYLIDHDHAYMESLPVSCIGNFKSRKQHRTNGPTPDGYR